MPNDEDVPTRSLPGDDDTNTDDEETEEMEEEAEEDIMELIGDPIGEINPTMVDTDRGDGADTDDGETTSDTDDEKPAAADVKTTGATEQAKQTPADTADEGIEDNDADTDDEGSIQIEEAQPDDEKPEEANPDGPDTDDKGSMGVTGDQPDDADDVQKITWENARGIPDRAYIAPKQNGGEGRLRAIFGAIYNVRAIADDVCWVSGDQKKVTTDGDTPDAPGMATDVHGHVAAGYATYDTDTDDDGREYISTIDTILNADLSVEAVLEYPSDPDAPTEIILEVAPTSEHHDPVTVQAPMAALETARDFREKILAEVPGVVLDGGQNSVNHLKQIVSADMSGSPTKHAHERITTVEVGDETRLVTPNGTLTPDGWVTGDDREHVWSDTAKRSGVIEMWELGADTLDDDALDTTLAAEAAEKLAALRDPNRDRWLSILAYAVASTHRPTLTNPSNSPIQHWSNLSVAGQADSGKSASLEKLMACLGAGSSGDMLTLSDTTPQAMLDATTASDVVTLGIDEYDSTQIDARKINKLHNYAKSASTGEMVKKSDSSYGDHTWHVESPLIISGEQQLDRSIASLTTRSIEIPFSRSPTHEGSPGRRAFHDLAALTDDDGHPAELHHSLALWQQELRFDADEDAVHSEWRDAAEWARDILADRGLAWGDAVTSERIMQHAETIAFGLRRYRAFVESIGADVDLSDEQIADAAEYAMRQKVGEGSAGTNNMDRFFELFASANRESVDYADEYNDYETWYSDDPYLRPGEEFDFVHYHNDKATRLRIHPKDAIAGISKYVRDHGLDAEVPDAATLRNWVEQAADDPDSYAEGVGLRTNGRRHIGVYVEDLVETVDAAHVDIDPRQRVIGDDTNDSDNEQDADESGMPQATRRGMIQRLVEAENDTAHKEETVKTVAAAANVRRSKVENDVAKMKQNGELYEPQEDRLNTT